MADDDCAPLAASWSLVRVRVRVDAVRVSWWWLRAVVTESLVSDRAGIQFRELHHRQMNILLSAAIAKR